MEKLLLAGSFSELCARGREVYVATAASKDAHFETHPSRLLAISPDHRVRELDVRPDPWINDLCATEDALLWTEQNHRMQAAWRRAICAIDLRAPRPVTRKIVDEESLRVGMDGDSHGGVLVSCGMFIGRITGAPPPLSKIVEAVAYGARDALDQVTFANALGSDGEHVIWTTREDDAYDDREGPSRMRQPRVPSRLLRASLRGDGAIEVLRVAEKGEMRFLGAIGRSILFESEEGGLLLRDADGRLHDIAGEPPGRGVLRTRSHHGDLWVHAYHNWEAEDQCVMVLRHGSKKLEQLPFAATRFDINEHAVYRLTSRGVHVTYF